MVPNKRLLGAYALAVGTILVGGAVAKYLSVEAGSAMCALGGLLGGRLLNQPDYARPPLSTEEVTKP